MTWKVGLIEETQSGAFQEENQYGTTPIMKSFGSSKARVSCQDGSPLRKVENGRYDFQINNFSGLEKGNLNSSKCATKIDER